MKPNKPTYEISALLRDCKKKQARVSAGAMVTAKSDFKLSTQSEVLAFIENGGIESAVFINSKAWGNNPNPDSVIMVDAYGFYSGLVYGYIAFLYQPKTKVWIIKSFKKNKEVDMRNLVYKSLLNKG